MTKPIRAAAHWQQWQEITVAAPRQHERFTLHFELGLTVTVVTVAPAVRSVRDCKPELEPELGFVKRLENMPVYALVE